MLNFVIQCITFVLRGTTVWRRRSWRSRACSDAKTSAEAKEVDIEGYISPRVRVVRIGSGRSVDRLKVELLWKEMRKHSWLASWRSSARATIVRRRPWMLLVPRSRAHRSRLPPGTSCERVACARATVACALLACARVLSRRAAKALEPEMARPGRCGAVPRCAERC